MTSRADIVNLALSFDGYLDGAGYDVANQFSADLSRPAEAYCADFVADVYKRAGLPLPSMSPNTRTGYAYCPDALAAARSKGAIIPSWAIQPADVGLMDWNGDGIADHTVLWVDRTGDTNRSIDGNSGASNVNGHRGEGGVHQHDWNAPTGAGNPLILAAIDMSKFVTFGGAAVHKAPGQPPAPAASGRRILMLKSPVMTGPVVREVQNALRHFLGPVVNGDGVYGPSTVAALKTFQAKAHLAADGICGRDTYLKLGL